MQMREIILQNAATLRELHSSVDITSQSREADAAHYEAWKRATARFQAQFDELAFPGGLQRQNSLLATYDPDAVESAIQFLEVDPMFFRSGYIKERFLRCLKRAPLVKDQKVRLVAVIIRRVDEAGRREFRAYCRLARAIQTTELRAQLEQRLRRDPPDVARRAKWMLEAMGSQPAG